MAFLNPNSQAFGAGLQVRVDFDGILNVQTYNHTSPEIQFNPSIGTLIFVKPMPCSTFILYRCRSPGEFTGTPLASSNYIVFNITAPPTPLPHARVFDSVDVTLNQLQGSTAGVNATYTWNSSVVDPGAVTNSWPEPAGLVPEIKALRAKDRVSPATLANGDAVEFEFYQDVYWGLVNRTFPNPASLSWLQPYNGNTTAFFGTDYSGYWLNAKTLRVVINNVTGNTMLTEVTRVYINATGELRDFSNTSAAFDGLTPFMKGGFATQAITTVWAVDVSSSSGYFAGDRIDIRLLLTSPFVTNDVASQSEIDRWFVFSQNIGQNYTGVWLDQWTLAVLISDATGANAKIGQLQVTCNPNSDLLDLYQLDSLFQNCISPVADGKWADRKWRNA